MQNYWIIWLVVSAFTISTVGLYKKFVTTKISGKILVVDRLSIKTVRRMVAIFTVVFALLYGVDSFLYATKFVETSIIYNIAYWVQWGAITIILVVAYNFSLRFIYNKAREENDKDVRDELRWRHMLKRG